MCRKYHNAGDLFEPEVESNVRKDLRLERWKDEQEGGHPQLRENYTGVETTRLWN